MSSGNAIVDAMKELTEEIKKNTALLEKIKENTKKNA